MYPGAPGAPGFGAYPPQQGYPPQGYPPQGYPPQGYPPQGYPPQGFPPQGYPPQGQPMPYQPGPPMGHQPMPQPMPQPMAQPQFGMSPLSANLTAFNYHFDADETIDVPPSDAAKEYGLLDRRKNDHYPQGKEYCLQFVKECQAKGLSFKIQVKKTKPYYTWIYELPGAAPAPVSLPLAGFLGHYEADETIECTPADVTKEYGLLERRMNDHYPQGKENCLQFLKECQAKGLSFKIQVKKTKPYYTWFYELAVSTSPLPPHLAAFARHYEADETINCTPADVTKEYGLLERRMNDHYPQGKENCLQFLKVCQAKGLSFKIQVKKTKPYYTWFYELADCSSPLPPNLAAFAANYEADETIECTPADVTKEYGLLERRKNDHYPQGKENCLQFLKVCQAKGLNFKIQVKKTKPYYTWFYQL